MEYAGDAIRALSMEGRMTVCNMSIEGGARAGLIAPDEKAFEYLKGRPMSPKGETGTPRCATGRRCAATKARISITKSSRRGKAAADRDLGHIPEDVVSITGVVPDPDEIADEAKRLSKHRALDYMGLKAGTKITDIKLDRIFIGSCTNGRIEDLARGRQGGRRQDRQRQSQCDDRAGLGLVKAQAEAEGLDKIFLKAGFEWREPGCSMCLAMNPDKLSPEERCASTSNRNFEGRQGFEGPHPSGVAGDGGGRGDRRAFCRYSRVAVVFVEVKSGRW